MSYRDRDYDRSDRRRDDRDRRDHRDHRERDDRRRGRDYDKPRRDDREREDGGRRRRSKWTDAEESRPAAPSNSAVRVINGPVNRDHNDPSLIRKKIYLPADGTNYIGLIIGPRGAYQKKLEQETGCKILIRGKGSTKDPSAASQEDEEDMHVLIMGETPDCVTNAVSEVNTIINSTDEQKNTMRTEQLKVAQEMNKAMYTNNGQSFDDSLLTPYGPPSPFAYIIPVPNDSIGLIIGKNGEMIRQLQQDSGAKIQVAKKEVVGKNVRYVFVEGSEDKYINAKTLIEKIVADHKRDQRKSTKHLERNKEDGPYQIIPIPENLVNKLYGGSRDGAYDVLRQVYERTGAKIFIPKTIDPNTGSRLVEISGDKKQIALALQEIAAFLSETEGGNGAGMLMMNPLYYAEMIGWNLYSNFAYPDEVKQLAAAQPQAAQPVQPSQPTGKINVAADQYAKYYQSVQGGDYQHYYDYYCKTYGNQPLPIPQDSPAQTASQPAPTEKVKASEEEKKE